MNLYTLITRLIAAITELISHSSLKDLDRLVALYRLQDDDALRTELKKLTRDDPARKSRPHPKGMSRWIFRYSETPALHALAIAVTLFDRHPCDLPAGSKAYDEQRLAALSLVEGQNVQMDTGEGKTYAIALTAVALRTRFPQVAVITANDYLARRDVGRVQSFFEAAGIACGHGLPNAEFRGISYITIDTLCFEYLFRTYFPLDEAVKTYPGSAAIIIDEIDSVLIDRNLDFQVTRSLPTQEGLWKQVFELAASIPETEFSYNPVNDRISLHAAAWERVAILGRNTRKPVSLLIELVAAALWANRAQAGRNYVVNDDGQIRLINRITGSTYESADSTAMALQHHVLGKDPAVSLSVAAIDGLNLLSRHGHVVGLSGTAREDTIYYLQTLRTLTGKIPRRFPRYPGEIRTLLSPSREHTLEYVVERIAEVAPRPVVIGTWSPEDARVAAEHVAASSAASKIEIATVTSFDSDADQHVFDVAGNPGRVTILSQGGSRGVDVRSQHRPLLIVLGRAYEPRLDRQFLGRVGRHGEPFDAEFILDPNSPIWNKALALSANMFGTVEPLVRTSARAVRTAQRDSWTYRTQARQRQTLLSRSNGDAEQAMAATFLRVQQLVSSEGWPDYIAELFSETAVEPPTSSSGQAYGQAQGPEAAGVLAAMARRTESDAFAQRLETALRAADPARLGQHRQTTITGQADETVALASWVEKRTAEMADCPDESAVDLFHRQVLTASAQRMPAPTSPRWRNALSVVHETLLMANANRIEQTKHRLESLRVSSSSLAYFRRGAYAVRNVSSLVHLTARRDLQAHLSVVDKPGKLDELFYSFENMIAPTNRKSVRTTFQRISGTESPVDAPATRITDELIDKLLASYGQQSGGLPLPEQSARVLLKTVLRPLIVSSGPVTGALLRRHVDLVIQGLVAAGIRGRTLRDHEQLIEAMLAKLFEDGVLPVRLPRRWRATGALARAWTFASTLPRLGVLAMGLLACVFGAAFLAPVAPGARSFASITTVVNLFGFGSLVEASPPLTLFGVVVAAHLLLRAAGLADPLLLLSRIAPVLVLGLTLALYSHGLANLGNTALTFLLLWMWLTLYFALERLVLTMVGIQGTLLFGAASVVAYVAMTALEAPGLLAPIGVGILAAAVGGPAIPVAVGSSMYAHGRFFEANDRTTVRVSLDPALLSCLIATIIVALDIGIRGIAELITFAVLQVLIFGIVAGRRLNATRVEGVLARLRVGTPLGSNELVSYLRRALIASIAVGAVATGAGVWLAASAGAQTLASVALAEWAGVLLVTGGLSVGSILSVAGLSTPFLRDDNLDRSPPLRERLRSWRQLRFARLIKYGLILLLLIRPLSWLSDWMGLSDAAQAVWDAVVHLVTQQ